MRAALVTAPGRLEILDVAFPVVHANDMLVAVDLCGVCGTDVHLAADPLPWPGFAYPAGLGHEIVGRVAEAGSEFPQEDALGVPLRIGDRVVVRPSMWSCGQCYVCRVLLAPNLCLRPPPPRPLPPWGGFATHYYVPEGSNVFRVPDDIPNHVAVLVEPMAGALRALERAQESGFAPGGTLVVQGAGAVGALLCGLGRLLGAAKVIVIGAPDERLALCRRMGATATLSIERTTSEERLVSVLSQTPHGLGADAVLEAAGTPEAFAEALDLARPGGIVVEFGHFTDRGSVPINPMVVCRKDLRILGVRGHQPGQFARCLRLLATYHAVLPFADLVTNQWSLDELPIALEQTRCGRCTKGVVAP